MNIGDPAIGGGDSVAIGDLAATDDREKPVTSSNLDLIVKREKPKRPPPPIIMSEIRVIRFFVHLFINKL